MPSTQDQNSLCRDALVPYDVAGSPIGDPDRRSRSLSGEQVELALGEARLRSAVKELPEDERAHLVDALLDELAEGRVELPEQLRERLLDGMLGALLEGRRGEAEILGRDGLLGEL